MGHDPGGGANDPFIGVEYQLSFTSYLYIMIHKGSKIIKGIKKGHKVAMEIILWGSPHHEELC